MTRHLINGKEWEERTFNHIGYGSVSHIFAMFPNEEALVLVRQKDAQMEPLRQKCQSCGKPLEGLLEINCVDCCFAKDQLARLQEYNDMRTKSKEEKPDYNNTDEWREVDRSTMAQPGWTYVLLGKPPTNQNPMPEIKPGDIIQIECGDTHGVWGFDVDDELNCFHFNSHEFSLISKSTVCKIRRPNKGVIWERGSK